MVWIRKMVAVMTDNFDDIDDLDEDDTQYVERINLDKACKENQQTGQSSTGGQKSRQAVGLEDVKNV
jgi:hypothetical protein